MHHEAGDTLVIRNTEQVLTMIEAVHLYNIVTEHAQPNVQADLTNVKEIGHNALTSKQNNEMQTMLRRTKLFPSGVDVDVENTAVRMQQSSTIIVHDDWTMQIQGTKSSLVKVILKETKVELVSTLPDVELVYSRRC